MASTPASQPKPKINRTRLDRHRLPRRQDHALRRLRPQRHFRAHHRRLLRNGHRARARHQDVGHRLLVQEPGLLHEPVAQLQHRPRTYAFGHHRRSAGQCEDSRARRQRRRRHRVHRHRAVRSPHAAQYPDDLHHRRQRRVRPYQGPVLRHRRSRRQAEDRASSTISPRSIPARWPSCWARPLSGALSPATRNSCTAC